MSYIKQNALYPASVAEDSLESLFASHGPQRPVIYWLVLVGVLAALVALPFIKVDISVRAQGWVRSTAERTDVRPAISGYVAQLHARDNDHVHAGQPLLTLHSTDVEERLARNQVAQDEHKLLIEDLSALTQISRNTAIPVVANVASPPVLADMAAEIFSKAIVRSNVMRQDRSQIEAQLSSYSLSEAKAKVELSRYEILTGKGAASQQDLDNARYEVIRLAKETDLLIEQTLSRWESRLHDEQTTVADLSTDGQRLKDELAHYTVRAPVEGVLIGFAGLSEGGFVAVGQTLGTVSPEDSLRVETYVSPKDIGFIRKGQAVRLQIDAFPYTQWGMVDGVVESISGDMLSSSTSTALPSGNYFKIVVLPSRTSVHLANGVKGNLRKGMTLSARFLVVRRNLLQILYEDFSGWLDPRTYSQN